MKRRGVCSVFLAAKWRLHHFRNSFFFSILMAPKCELYFSTRISYCKLLMQYLYFTYGVLVQDCTMLKSLITQSSFIFVSALLFVSLLSYICIRGCQKRPCFAAQLGQWLSYAYVVYLAGIPICVQMTMFFWNPFRYLVLGCC